MKANLNIKNKKASFEYFFIRHLVAGLQLFGTEVVSIKKGKVSLVDSYCYFLKGELFVKGMNIPTGEEAFMHEPLRDKKLLLNRKELNKLERDLDVGMTIVVTRLFTSDRGLIKADIALAKGKKQYDKRETLKEKDIKREMQYES